VSQAQAERTPSRQYKGQAEEFEKHLYPDPLPKSFKTINLMAVKRFTKIAHGAFLNTRNAGLLAENETFNAADKLLLRGTNVVLGAV
jgi:hypothetical protein